MKNLKYGLSAGIILWTLLMAFTPKAEKHTLYIIGDSTVRNSRGDGGPGQWGWGTFIDDFFDSSQLAVSNQAMAGRSTDRKSVV